MERWIGLAATAVALLALGGGTAAQCQRAKLAPAELDCWDLFGSSVAIDGNWAMVGAPLDDDVFEQSGAVYVFHRVGRSWQQTQKLKASDARPGMQFGDVLDLDGSADRLVVGAHTDAPQGVQAAGSAYVFERLGETWIQRAKLWANDPIYDAQVGSAVTVSGGRIALGARQANGVSLYSGLAYVFEGSGSSWGQVARLIPSDAAQGDGFGDEVALDGTRLVVTAPSADLTQGHDVGVAYVFDSPAPGLWVERQKLVPGDGAASDFFGTSVDIEGDMVLVGATAHDGAYPNSGAAYVFQWSGSSWTETQELASLDADAEELFGSAVAIDDDLALVDCHGDSDLGWTSGAAYAFRREGSTWVQIGKVLANDGAAQDLLGLLAVGLSGTTAIIGCRTDDDAAPLDPGCQSGSAYVFELAPTAAQYGSCATNAPCGNPDAHGGCANSTGRGAILQACGSGSVASDDLVLEARALPPNTSGILFMGAGQTYFTFGDGKRVVATGGVGFFRFGVQQANAQGVMVRGPGLVAQSQGFVPAGQIAAGQTWNFQCWYRNPAGPCGSFFNLSNGVSVGFTP